MTAIIDAEHKTIDCPHCKGKLNVEIERKAANVKIEERGNDETSARLNKLEQLLTKEVEKQPEKPKKETVLPSFVPGYVCKDCGDVHKNKNYKKKAPFKCSNCGQFSASDKASCPWCGDKDWEELDEDEMSMLPEPVAEAHTHEDD